jgi:hypothetical protein
MHLQSQLSFHEFSIHVGQSRTGNTVQICKSKNVGGLIQDEVCEKHYFEKKGLLL